MWIYYNELGNVSTRIAHGKTVRQHENLDLYLCFDPVFFGKSTNEQLYNYLVNNSVRIVVQFKKPSQKEFGETAYISTNDISIEKFTKTSTSEVTYDFVNGKRYVVVHYHSNANLLNEFGNYECLVTIYDTSEQSINIDGEVVDGVKRAGVCNIYVDKTYGKTLPNTHITPSQYDFLLSSIGGKMDLNEYDIFSLGSFESLESLARAAFEAKQTHKEKNYIYLGITNQNSITSSCVVLINYEENRLEENTIYYATIFNDNFNTVQKFVYNVKENSFSELPVNISDLKLNKLLVTDSIKVPTPTEDLSAVNKQYLEQNYVGIHNNEEIDGSKTFTGSVYVEEPTESKNPTNKQYVDSNFVGIDNDQEINGTKTFNKPIYVKHGTPYLISKTPNKVGMRTFDSSGQTSGQIAITDTITENQGNTARTIVKGDDNQYYGFEVSKKGMFQILPEGNKALATEKYVDDNVFSGDYNDLSNKPQKTSMVLREKITSETHFSLKEIELNGDKWVIEIPKKISEFVNDVGYITKDVENLESYYTKDEVDSIVGSIQILEIQKVDKLPTTNISSRTIYLVPSSKTEEDNVYDEYIYINNDWEIIGTTKVDLSNYYTIPQTNEKFVKLEEETNKKLQNYLGKEETAADSNLLGSKSPEHYLDYNNFTNVPDIPSKITDLENDSEFLDKSTNQEVDSTKTFINNNEIQLKNKDGKLFRIHTLADGRLRIGNDTDSTLIALRQDNTIDLTSINPKASNSIDIGSSGAGRWRDLYLAGSLKDDTNSVKIEEIATKEELKTKLNKNTTSYSTPIVYARGADGTSEDRVVQYSPNAYGQFLIQRDANGMFFVNEPTQSNHPASKNYIDTQLTAETLINNIGKASSSLDGIMSKEDKANLDTLVGLLTEDDDEVVNKINEVLAIFNKYPEGTEILTVLADKVSKDELPEEIPIVVRDVVSEDTVNTLRELELNGVKWKVPSGGGGSIDNVVDLNSNQTISGIKTFSIGPVLQNEKYLKVQNNSGTIFQILGADAANKIMFGHSGMSNIAVLNTVRPDGTVADTVDLGTSNQKWKDIYLSGKLSDGTNSISISQIVNMLSTLTREQLVSIIGEASQTLSGLMSTQDKTSLDALTALLQEDEDNVVNKINEILDIFDRYPEGSNLLAILSDKVNKDEIPPEIPIVFKEEASADTTKILKEIEIDNVKWKIPEGGSTDNAVDLTSDQEIDGIKTFNERPLVKVLGAKLPTDYQEVEYIESTGTQFIDTGIIGRYGISSYCKISVTSDTSANAVLLASRKDTGDSRYYIGYRQYLGNITFGYETEFTSSSKPAPNTIKEYEYICKNNTLEIKEDGVTTMTTSISYSYSTNRSLYVFANNYAGVMNNPLSCKLYALKMYDEDTLVRNFVPCYRKSDNIIGLYDTVFNVFYANQGSGTFLKGDDVSVSNEESYVNVATLNDIPDTYTKEESDSKYIPYAGDDTLKGGLTIGKGGLTLGVTNGNGLLFPSSVISEGAQCSIGVYNPIDGIYCTLVGFINGPFTIGHSSFTTNIRGKNTRPTYNGNELALKSDLDTIDVSRDKLISTIGEATSTLSGLMSAEDKTNLDTLVSLLSAEEDENVVVDRINEILSIFNQYPEGADLVSALAGKADKNSNNNFSVTQTITGNDDTPLNLYAKHTTDANIAFYNSSGARLGNIGAKNNKPYWWGGQGTNEYVALVSDIPTDYIDLSSNQEIDGVKTFSERPLVKVLGAKLPTDYQEVEYIESTGTQQINTNVQVNANDFEIEGSFVLTQALNNEQHIYSLWNSSYNYWTLFVHPSSKLDVYASGHHYSSNTVAVGVKYPIKVRRESNSWIFGFDSIDNTFSYTPAAVNPGTIVLFKQADGGEPHSHFKLYETKIKVSGTLVRDLIPCYRKSDNVIGMYDTVSGSFFTNQGTGTFLKGEDVSVSNEEKNASVATLEDFKTINGESIVGSGDIPLDSKITNSALTTVSVGGIQKGVSLQGKSVVEILESIFFPYVAFSLSTLYSSPSSSSVYEKGFEATLSSVTQNITLGSEDLYSLKLYVGDELLAEKTSGITSSNTFSNLNKKITSTSTLKVVGTDGKTTLEKTLSIFKFVDPFYYGVLDTNSTPSATTVTSKTKDVSDTGNKTYKYTCTNKFPFIAYPSSYGTLTSILDGNGFENLTDFTPHSISINGEGYYVYIKNSAATITDFSYTFKGC